MPTYKISQLTTATAVSATNQFEINQNGTSKSVEVSVIDAYIKSTSNLPVVVSVSSATDAVRITQTGTGNALVVEDSTNPDASPFVVNASGNVGIGTSSPGGALSVYRATGTAQWAIQTLNNANTDGSGFWQRSDGSHEMVLRDASNNANFITNQSNDLEFVANGAERMRITSGGDLLVGTSSAFGGATAGLQVQNGGEQIRIKNTNNANYWRMTADNNNTVYIINQSTLGVFIANGGSAWSGLSDERAKDIIEPIQGAASKVSQLRAVIGKYKADEEGKRRSFLIAQDVQAVLPEAVSIADPETGYLGLAYTDVIPLLTAALQEALAEIASLKARLTALEEK